MRNRNSKLAPVLRAMNAFTAPAPAERLTCPACFGYGEQQGPEAVIASWTDNNTGLTTVIRPICPQCGGCGTVDAPGDCHETAELRDHLIDAGDIPDFAVGDSVRRKSKAYKAQKVGVIVALIPAVERTTYVANKAPAKARVRWPDRTRLGGNGYSHSTIALSALVKDEPIPAVTCARCGAVVDGDALTVQTAADGTPKLDNWYCRAHLVAGTERLKAAIRTQREGDA